MGRTVTDVSACDSESLKIRFPSSNVSTVALGIPFCKQSTLVAISGLEWTAAYCKLPHKPLSWCSASSVVGLSGVALLSLGTSIYEAYLMDIPTLVYPYRMVCELFYIKTCKLEFSKLPGSERQRFLELFQSLFLQ